MFSEILHIGPIVLRSYGLMLAISFFAGLFYVRNRAIKEKIDQNFIMNLAFLAILAGIVGARLFYVLFHWTEFSGNLLNAFNPFNSTQFGIAGLNLYGGFICAILTALIYISIKKQNIFQILDIFAPAIALGIFITRIGCFLNGCCYGIPCDLPWAVTFPENSIPHFHFGDQPLHPAQLYSSLYGLLLFMALDRIDRRKKFFGTTFSYLLIVEALFRYLIEYVRYYEPEMVTSISGVEFTYNHLIAILLFVIGIILRFTLPGRQSIPRN